MNLIFTNIYRSFDYELFQEIYNKFDVEKCAIVMDNRNSLLKPLKQFVEQNSERIHAVSFRNCEWGRYKNAPFFDECTPIDEELIEKMAPYQLEIMKMLDRQCSEIYDRRVRHYQSHLRYWNYILDKLKIDIYVANAIPHEAHDYIIYRLCKIKNIKVITSLSSFIPQYSYVIDGDLNTPVLGFEQQYLKLQQKYQDVREEEIKLPEHLDAVYRKYTNPLMDKTPYYMHNEVWLSEFSSEGAQRNREEIYKNRLDAISLLEENLDSSDNLFAMQIEGLFNSKKVFREVYYCLTYYQENCSNFSAQDKYFYVPLHFQPEATTGPLGGQFVDQLLYIKMVSFFLPNGYYLYVKEHPAQYPFMKGRNYGTARNIDFYQELAKLKNVKLMSLEEDTYKLIDHCIAIASVTGTVLLEGVFQGKPGLMFGSDIKRYLPGVFSVKTNEQCKNIINKIIHKEIKINRKDIKIYFKTLSDFLYFDYDASSDSPNLRREQKASFDIMDAFIKKIEEVYRKN